MVRPASRQRPYSLGSARSSLIARCSSRRRGMVVGEDEFRQWVLAQYRGASTPRGETGPDDPSSAEEYPRGSDAGSVMASWGLPRPSTRSTSRTSPLTRSSERTAVIPPVVSMPAWVSRLRRQRHRGGRPDRTHLLSRVHRRKEGRGDHSYSRRVAYAKPIDVSRVVVTRMHASGRSLAWPSTRATSGARTAPSAPNRSRAPIAAPMKASVGRLCLFHSGSTTVPLVCL